MNDAREEYWRRMQALIAEHAKQARPLRVIPRRASGAVICIACKERMLDGSGELHAKGECGTCRDHLRGTVSAPVVRPYGDSDGPRAA